MKDNLNLDYLNLIINEINYITNLLSNYKYCKKMKINELLETEEFKKNIEEVQKIDNNIKEFKELMYMKKYNLLRERKKIIENLYDNLK